MASRNKISTTVINSKSGTDHEVEVAGHYLTEREKPLKTLVMLHVEPVWIAMILSTIIIQFQMILYNITFRGKLFDVTNEAIDYPMQSYLTVIDSLYCADFLLALSYRSWKSISSVSGIQPRNMISLLADFLSLIPIDTLLWYGSHMPTTNPRVFHLWSLNHLIRIYRVYTFFEQARNSFAYVSVHVQIFEVLTFLLVFSMLGTVLMFELEVDVKKDQYAWLGPIVERLQPTDYRPQDWFWISFYVVIGHISSHGTVELPKVTSHLPFTIFGVTSALVIRSLLLAYMIDIFRRRDYAGNTFALKRMILEELITSAVAKPTRERIFKYYTSFWETRLGQKLSNTDLSVYPAIFIAECSLELSWDTFKHSKLFRHMPVPFLRNMSLLCERQFVLPGDFIIKKFDLKDRMIYIVSGSVHVLSEEDDETPILSFSGGTIIGEVALFASCRSGVSLLACTLCELNVLTRNEFTRGIISIYPELYEEMTSAVDRRIESAKFMTEIGIHLQKNQNICENNRNTDVAWLKTTLGALQGARRDEGSAEEIRERADLMEKVYAATDIRYTFMYLDTIVLSDNIALAPDAIFVRSKCPWIFQPESPFIQLWDAIVLICTMALSYIIVISVSIHDFATNTIYAWTNLLGLVMLADFWIIMSTAIQKTDRMIIIKVSQIMKIRCHDWRFWFDLLSAIPWTFLVDRLPIKYAYMRYLKLQCLLKLYKLELMFMRIENSHKLSLVALRTIKYSIYVLLVTFLLTSITVIATCPTVDGKLECPPTSWIMTSMLRHMELLNNKFSYVLLVILQIVLGIGTPLAKPGAPVECACWVIIMIAGALMFIFYMASLTSVRVLGQVVFSRHFNLTRAIRYHLNKTTVPGVLKERVDAYLETELFYDKGYRVATNEDVLGTLRHEVAGKWKHEIFGHFISTIPLFMQTDQGFVRDICSIVTVGVLPPKEILSYGRRQCMEMYIIEKGYCEMVHMEPSIPHRKVGPGTAIYPFEMCLNLPAVHTVVTSTYVSFLTINRSDFLRIYSSYPEEKFEFDHLMAQFQKMDRVVELREVIKGQPEYFEVLHSVHPPVPSFTYFVYTLNKEDPEYYVINEPFEQLNNLKFIKWFLMRLTLRPDGMFIKFYEAQRCLCAIMTVIFYTMKIVIESRESGTISIQVSTFFNIAAAVDIYVRMHVSYFNEKGLLVTHPLATANNYMKTSMFIDIVGLVPFENFIRRQSSTSMDLFYFYLTRILQLHRVVGASNYLQKSGSWLRIMKYGKFLPILVVIAHVFACAVLYASCSFDIGYDENANFEAGLRCPQGQSLIEESTEYQLTVWMLYRRSLYIAISTLTRCGVEELEVKTLLTMSIVYIMCSVTFLVLLLLMAQIMADSAIRDVELTAYQDRMRTLVKFMNNKRISPELYDEVIYYFELSWKAKRGQSVDQLFKSFHSALREDVLCALYEKSLAKCPGFVNAGETFYRYLLVHMKGVWFYPNGSVVTHYNDVFDFVIVMHSGRAEVIAPDGSFITTLGPGSIYGNLIGSTYIRMPISVVITAHSEVLVFEALAFFRALSIHGKARRIFLNSMELNTDYIRGIVDDDDPENVSSASSSQGEESHKSTPIVFRFFHLLSMTVVDPNWLPIVLWDRNCLFFSYYLSPCAIIYQIAYGHFHVYWIGFQYFTDFLFLVTMYLKVHSIFEDADGNTVRDKKRIWFRFIKSPMGFYLHLASVVPLELIAFIFRDRTMQKTYTCLRVNRILRLAVVVDFFNIQCERLNINIFKMRLAYLVMILFFTIHLASCIMAAMLSETDMYDLDDADRSTAYFQNTFTVAALYGSSITRRLSLTSTWYHTLYIMILQIILFVMFALIVGDMCAMVNVRHYVMITYERLIRRFKTYMETCDLTYVLRKNLWTYGCNLWEFNRGRQIPYLVLEAPSYLRRAIKNALFIHHLEDHQIFSGCHEDFLRQVADYFILINFFADDLIANIGDINGDMYFINAGRVLTIYHDPNDISREKGREIYEEGESFGILSGLFPRYPHEATYRAYQTCKVLILNRRKWFHLLEHFPASGEHIYSIANRLRLRTGPNRLNA